MLAIADNLGNQAIIVADIFYKLIAPFHNSF